jgi:hypothetical protein
MGYRHVVGAMLAVMLCSGISSAESSARVQIEEFVGLVHVSPGARAGNGTGAYTYDRIGRGTLHIRAACLSPAVEFILAAHLEPRRHRDFRLCEDCRVNI